MRNVKHEVASHFKGAFYPCFSLRYLLLWSILLFVSTLVLTKCDAQTEPPQSGDWIVSDDTSVIGRSIILNGNLTITPNGHLVLVNVDLMMNGSVSNILIIKVQSGGLLDLKDRDHNPLTTIDQSIVHSLSSRAHYVWLCEPESTLIISCSVVKDCGISSPGPDGLMLKSSDVLIENSTFKENYCGICIDDSSPKIENTTFIENEKFGVSINSGSPVIEWCNFTGNLNNGASVTSPNGARIQNCSFWNNQGVGINWSAGTMSIVDSKFSNNSEFDIDCRFGCNGFIQRIEIKDGLYSGIYLGENCRIGIWECVIRNLIGRGIWIQGAVVSIWRVTIRDCAESLYVNGPPNRGVIIEDCLFEGSSSDNIVVVNNLGLQLTNCTVTMSGKNGINIGTPILGDSTIKVIDCTVNQSENVGILIEPSSYCYLENVVFADNKNYALYCRDGGKADWYFYQTSAIVNQSIKIGGEMTVWGKLSLINTNLVFDSPAPGDRNGIKVIGGELNILDNDGDNSTMTDATTITATVYPAWPGQSAQIRIEQHGNLIARNSRFIDTLLDVWASTIQVEGCEFLGNETGISVDFIGPINTCRIATSTFVESRTGILILSDNTLDVYRCTFRNCNISVDIHAGKIDLTQCFFETCGVGINGTGTAVVTETRFIDCREGIVFYGGMIELAHSSFIKCKAFGLRLERVDAILSFINIDSNSAVEVMADLSDMEFDRCRIIDKSEIQIILGNSKTHILNCTIIGDLGYAINISGGQLRLDDSSINGKINSSFDANMDAKVEIFNTSVQTEFISAMDTSTVDIYWQFLVRVLLSLTGNPPPPPVQITVKDLINEEVLYTSLNLDGTTSWTWARQLHATFKGLGLRTPHMVTVSIGVHDFNSSFELSSRYEHTVFFPVSRIPVITYDGPVEEGREVDFDGSGSSCSPFDIMTWEWDFEYNDGFSLDALGIKARWTFVQNGTFAVALRIIDTRGTENLTVITIIAEDTAPRVRFVGYIPQSIYEDEVIRFEGAYELAVDPVISQAWDFGDNQQTNGASAEHSWSIKGNYTVVFIVVDLDFSISIASITIEVRNMVPVALTLIKSIQAGKNRDVLFDGAPSYDTVSDLKFLVFLWDLGDGTSISGMQITHMYKNAGNYTVTMHVTDDENATNSTTLTVEIINFPPRISHIADIVLRDDLALFTLKLEGMLHDPDDSLEYLTLTIFGNISIKINVSVQWNPTEGWIIIFHPNLGWLGTDSISLLVIDTDGARAQDIFNVTVYHVPRKLSILQQEWKIIVIIIITVVAGSILLNYTRKRKVIYS